MKKPNIENGPWSVRQHDVIYSDKSGRFIADCERTPHDKRPAPPDEKDRIHAKFLAAAPAMAEALEAALVGLESDILYCERHPDSHSTTHEGMLAHKRKRLNDAKAALTLAGYEF